jgi:hypothetical protein
MVQDLRDPTVQANKFRTAAGVFEAQVNLEDLPMGMYLLQLQTTQKRFLKKVMPVK